MFGKGQNKTGKMVTYQLQPSQSSSYDRSSPSSQRLNFPGFSDVQEGFSSRGTRTVVREVRTGGTVTTERVVTETMMTSSGTQRKVTQQRVTTDAPSRDFQTTSRFDKLEITERPREPVKKSPVLNYRTTHLTPKHESPPPMKKSPKMVKRDNHKPEVKPQKTSAFIDDVIRAHNKYRRLHGRVGDLRHNKEMTEIAQKYAERLAASNCLRHSGDTYHGKPLGENLASKWGSGNFEYTGADATDQWYNEVKSFDFRRNQFASGTGHFTQVVWKGSREIGVGKATSRNGAVFVVCNYFPAGNVCGQFKDNVFPA